MALAGVLKITDTVVWFKHVDPAGFRERLQALRPEEEIFLETDGIVGTWRRMKTGEDGRAIHGIKPVGSLQPLWNDWFKARKGEAIPVREVIAADDCLAAATALFSEWSSVEDEENFRDL